MSKLLNSNSRSIFITIIILLINNVSQAQADETSINKNHQYYCGKSSYKPNLVNNSCGNIFKILKAKTAKNGSKFIFQSKINNLKYQESVSNDTGIADYLVPTILGVYFPTLETVETDAGGSFFGGIKLQENIRLDAEIVGIFEGNSVEKAYFDIAAFLGLRFSLPLGAKKSSLSLYLSPGVGISELDTGYTNQDDEDTYPTWQLEGGIALPIHKNLGGYGGMKYVNQLSDEGESFLGAECGITLRL
jgi:hypothetical protein